MSLLTEPRNILFGKLKKLFSLLLLTAITLTAYLHYLNGVQNALNYSCVKWDCKMLIECIPCPSFI